MNNSTLGNILIEKIWEDELIFEVPENELTEYAASIKAQMQNAIKLRVPLVASAKAGRNWYELKKLP